MSDTYIPRGAGKRQTAATPWFNLDNGAGTTIDDVILCHSQAISLKAARIVYVDAQTGTVAAGNAKLGSAAGGAQYVAATAYENSKAVGTTTAMTVLAAGSFIAAGQAIFVRHTGVGATQAGQARIFIEYEVLP